MNEEIKIGDYVEYKGETYTVMAIDTFIAINYNNNNYIVENNCDFNERNRLYKQGWKEDDPLYWVDKAELKIVKMLRDFE